MVYSKVEVLKYLDKLAAPSKSIGSCNTVYLDFPEGSDKPILVGTNTDYLGVRSTFSYRA